MFLQKYEVLAKKNIEDLLINLDLILQGTEIIIEIRSRCFILNINDFVYIHKFIDILLELLMLNNNFLILYI